MGRRRGKGKDEGDRYMIISDVDLYLIKKIKC